MSTYNPAPLGNASSFNSNVDTRISNPALGANVTYTTNTGQYVVPNTGIVPSTVDTLNRNTTGFTSGNVNVAVPNAGTSGNYYNPGAAVPTTNIQRYSNQPPTGNLGASGNYGTQNSYNNPIDIGTAARNTIPVTTPVQGSTYQPNKPPLQATTNTYTTVPAGQTGNIYTNNTNTRPLVSGPQSNTNSSACKTYALVGLGLLALTGIILGLLFGLGVIGGKSRDLDYKPQDTTVTTETVVIDKSNSTTAPTTTTTVTTNGTVAPTPIPVAPVPVTPVSITNTTTTTTTVNTTTTTPTVTFPTVNATTTTTTPTTTTPTTYTYPSGTAGTTYTYPSGTPQYTYVYPKHHLQRKFVD